MNAYFDTSAFMPLVLAEATTTLAQTIWRQSRRVASARLLYPEGCAGLALARRTGRASPADVVSSAKMMEQLLQRVDQISLSAAIAHRAGRLADLHDLRGCDAIHLATAEAYADADTVFVAGDRDLCAAARDMGLAVAELIGGS